MDVSVIIVNYNTTALTLQCVASIFAHTREASFEVIVIDNASEGASIETVTQHFPAVTLIRNTENRGFGSANNQGIRVAKGEFIFLLNSDTLLHSDAAAYFTKYMRDAANKNVAVCGGELSTGTEKQTPSFGNFPSLMNSFSSIGFNRLYLDHFRKHIAVGVTNYDQRVKDVDWISGADMFIRRSVLDEVGGFDKDFFLFFEETELCNRIRKAGYVCRLLPEVKITHIEGSSASGDSDAFNYSSYRYYHNSRRLYHRKTGGIVKAFIANLLDTVTLLSRTATGREKGSLLRKLKMLWG